ncbi:MAG: DUF4430 domain-containing protein [Planctomycetota bacterium]
MTDRFSFLVGLFSCMVLLSGCGGAPAVELEPIAEDQQVVVHLHLPVGEDGQFRADADREFELIGRRGGTLGDAMLRFDEVPMKWSGDGEMLFLTTVGGQANSGEKGWTFEVDGQWSNVGVGQLPLEREIDVRWIYGSMQAP